MQTAAMRVCGPTTCSSVEINSIADSLSNICDEIDQSNIFATFDEVIEVLRIVELKIVDH